MSGSERLSSYRRLVDARMEALLPDAGSEPSRLHEAMRHSALAPGKRLRPLLALACAEAVGGAPESALDAACALEFVHAFSLIHDDLPAIDDDDLRRGLPTCHVVYGEAMAILAGDALFALAFESLLSSEGPPRVLARAGRILAESAGTLVSGEVLDILGEGVEPTPESVDLIHRRKTASLISASCSLGGLFGGADDGTVDRLARFGAAIGLAFQIQDDILNEVSTAEELGKAVGSDRERSKQTYPAVHGLDESRRRLAALVDEAESILAGLPGDRSLLVELARFSADRRH